MREHTATALNFQITIAIAYVVSYVLSLVFVGILLMIAVEVVDDRVQHHRRGQGQPGPALHLPALDQVRELIGFTPSEQAPTTASASSRPRRVSTSTPGEGGFRVDELVGDQARHGVAPAGVQRRDLDALADAREQQHPLDLAGRRVEHLAADRGRYSRGHAVGIRRRVLGVPPAHAADVAVRAGADAPPVVTAPVAEVVARSMRVVGRPVADLVPVEPGLRRAGRRPTRTCRPRGRPTASPAHRA